MARVQLGRQLTEAQISRIVAFLGSLTGPVPEDFATAPVLPSAAFHATEATNGRQSAARR